MEQIWEQIRKAKVLLADLTGKNPNVFYELALRHATGKPTIHLIRGADRIPFDIDQFRTIKIDTSDLYAFVPQIETYRAGLWCDGPPDPVFVYYPLGIERWRVKAYKVIKQSAFLFRTPRQQRAYERPPKESQSMVPARYEVV